MAVDCEWFNGENRLAESYPDANRSFAWRLWKCSQLCSLPRCWVNQFIAYELFLILRQHLYAYFNVLRKCQVSVKVYIFMILCDLLPLMLLFSYYELN